MDEQKSKNAQRQILFAFVDPDASTENGDRAVRSGGHPGYGRPSDITETPGPRRKSPDE